MGMEAEVLAVGPYHPRIAGCLEYSPDNYRCVQPGTRVVSVLFCCNTNDTSRRLAEAMGCRSSEPATWHFTDISGFDLDEMAEVADRGGYDGKQEVVHLRMLAALGFEFFFRPND